MMKNYFEVIIESTDETKDIKKFNVKTRMKAIAICNKYCNNNRVMINQVDEVYGECENIYDNKDVIDGINELEKELNETL